MTLIETEKLLRTANFPHEVFGDDVAEGVKRLRIALHPDKFTDLGEKQQAEALTRLVSEWETLAETPELLKVPNGAYLLGKKLGNGDISTVRMALSPSITVRIAKIGVNKGVTKLLTKETEILHTLHESTATKPHGKYFPVPIEKIDLPDGCRASIFAYVAGLVPANEIKAAYPNGVGGRHMIWMFKRLLSAIGYATQIGFVHGAVLPPHLLFHPESHGLQLVDWTLAIPVGKAIVTAPAAYKDWYPPECLAKKPVTPATDIYMAAKCLLWLAGGDPVAETFPDNIPIALKGYLQGCLLKSPSMRPQDAWKMLEEVSDVGYRLYGAPKFVELKV